MKTLAQVKKENPEYSTLIGAVIRRVGMDSVNDIINNGIDGGFSGFIYYTDTVKFWKTHKKDILKMAEQMADDLGDELTRMVGSFNCLKYFDYKSNRWTDREGQRAVQETLFGRKVDDLVGNAMAWYAAEEVCRMFEDYTKSQPASKRGRLLKLKSGGFKMKKYTIAEVKPIAMKDIDALLVHWAGYDWQQTADEQQDEYQRAIDNAPQEDIDRAISALTDALNSDDIRYSKDRKTNIETARGSL